MTRPKAFTVIGHSLRRPDVADKVTGRAVYAPDLSVPDMLHAKVLWSSRPHARLVSIDTARARALPGVQSVVTAADAPATRYGVYLFDQPVLARDKVIHIGEPVAAVAAESEAIAEQALQLIEVHYEDLPAVFDPLAAMEPGAPLLHPDLASYIATYDAIKYGNVCLYTRLKQGDLAAGFAAADHIYEDTFRTQAVQQSHIEPRAAVAGFDFSGKLTIWTSTQQVSSCQAEVAKALGLPITKVRVIATTLGGGFGAKLKSTIEPIVALLALKTRRHVRLIMTREEEFVAGRVKPPYSMTLKTGVKSDGRITAKYVRLVADCGGYSDHTLGTVGLAVTFAQGPYRIPNAEAEGYCVYTNNPNFGCMRGYGVADITFATESQMDMIADRLGMDPTDFRRKNLAREGDVILSTQALRSVTIAQTMDTAMEASGWQGKRGQLGLSRGIGMANTILNMGLLASSAVIRFNEDGTANILTGIVDVGTGAHGVLCQIAAEELGLPLEAVTMAAVDSDISPYDLASIASRTTWDTGNAVRLAAIDAKKRLLDLAADVMKIPADQLETGQGYVYARAASEQRKSIRDLCLISLFDRQGPIIGQGSYLGEAGYSVPVGEGYPQPPTPSFVFGTHIAEVSVDRETGKVTVERLTAAHDVGRAINPLGVVGQIEGGAVQGIGFALYEQMLIKDGKVLNASLLDYKLPTILDIPDVQAEIIEIPDAKGPFGAKGVGEPPLIGPAAAIANAIYDAVGVRITELPCTPEKILRALETGSGSNV
jgi:CO/xanthine dehydrogenase Mo-binding subunit